MDSTLHDLLEYREQRGNKKGNKRRTKRGIKVCVRGNMIKK